jgi:hypothetical protein
MTLKNEIEKEMYAEGIEDRIQDIASLIDSPLKDVQKRMKTLGFADYIKLMSALKTKDAFEIKDMLGLSEGWSELPAMPEKYKERDGLEGPIMTKSGKVVYYDPKEGSYYDPDTDIYLSYDEWKALDEAYSMGSQGPDPRGKDAYVGADEEEPVGTTKAQDASAGQKLKTLRTQAMQRLGRDNLGGATAAQTADAMDKAEQGKPLTPIQRQAMAHQAANLDGLSMSPDTRIQFRNLLNRLRKQQGSE